MRKAISILTVMLVIFIMTMSGSFAVNEDPENTAEQPAQTQNENNDTQTDQNGQEADGSGADEQSQDEVDDVQDEQNDNTSDESSSDDTDPDGNTDETVDDTDEETNDETEEEENKDNDEEKENADDKSSDGKKQVSDAAKETKLSKEDENRALELEKQIEQMEREMATIEAKLKEIQKRMDSLEKRRKEMTKELNTSQESMGKRLRVMYKSGSIGFLDVVLNSKDVGEMVSNVGMVKRIFTSDAKSIRQLKKEHKELAEEEKKLKEAKKEQKEILKNQLKKMDEQNDTILSSALLFAKGAGNYKGGKLLWPCPSSHRISSKFGWRICPFHGRELHRGIDIPTYTGASILAAYDGVVIRSTYSSGYGNYVMISHGGGLATLYAHNSSLVVRAGQKVKQGQIIAKAGSTGPSTGTHCHFEVQLNGKLADPMTLLK